MIIAPKNKKGFGATLKFNGPADHLRSDSDESLTPTWAYSFLAAQIAVGATFVFGRLISRLGMRSSILACDSLSESVRCRAARPNWAIRRVRASPEPASVAQKPHPCCKPDDWADAALFQKSV